MMLAVWPFEKDSARRAIRSMRERCVVSDNQIHRVLSALWAAKGLPVADPTIDVARQEKRRATRATIRLPIAAVRVLVQGIPVLLAEFAGNWLEFCLTNTYGVDYYGLEPRDLVRLRHTLLRALQARPSSSPRARGLGPRKNSVRR